MVGEIFRTCPDRPWGPPSLLYNGYRVFPGGKERPGRDADPSPLSSAVGQERVELDLYSPYGPYGLYRASVPVQDYTLPLPYRLHESHVQANPHFAPSVVAFVIYLPGFLTNTSSELLICPVHATFSAHLILQYSV